VEFERDRVGEFYKNRICTVTYVTVRYENNVT